MFCILLILTRIMNVQCAKCISVAVTRIWAKYKQTKRDSAPHPFSYIKTLLHADWLSAPNGVPAPSARANHSWRFAYTRQATPTLVPLLADAQLGVFLAWDNMAQMAVILCSLPMCFPSFDLSLVSSPSVFPPLRTLSRFLNSAVLSQTAGKASQKGRERLQVRAGKG